jgi:hypothetical protein
MNNWILRAIGRGEKLLPKTSRRWGWYPPACRMCGLSARVALNDRKAYHCLWYNVYLPEDQAADPKGNLRVHCLNDTSGDNFVWRVRGVTPMEMLKYQLEHETWSYVRAGYQKSLVFKRYALLISFIALITGTVFSILNYLDR